MNTRIPGTIKFKRDCSGTLTVNPSPKTRKRARRRYLIESKNPKVAGFDEAAMFYVDYLYELAQTTK
jgi:hypothetical protein